MKYTEYIFAIGNHFLLIFFTILFKPFFFLNKKEIWFFCDRPFGIDNAYFQYQFSKENNQNIKSVYLCENKKDQLFKNLESDKNIVFTKSLKHFWYFIHAKKIIFSFDTYPFYFSSKGIYFKKILKPKTKLIFLQHGIIQSEVPSLKKENTFFNLFLTTTKKEKESIKKWSGYGEKELKTTGLSRFDNLLNSENEKIILFAPTWENKILEFKNENFKQTKYFKEIINFLNSEILQNILEKNGYKLNYLIHQKLEKFSKLFFSKNKNIKIIKNGKKKGTDFHSLIKKSNILITNYSSISFDFGYQKKPIIYWNFSDYHYNFSYFSQEKNGFGKVTKSIEETMNELETILKNNSKIENKCLENIEKFFDKIDDENCERINKEILKI